MNMINKPPRVVTAIFFPPPVSDTRSHSQSPETADTTLIVEERFESSERERCTLCEHWEFVSTRLVSASLRQQAGGAGMDNLG